jgi:hypothetical protein
MVTGELEKTGTFKHLEGAHDVGTDDKKRRSNPLSTHDIKRLEGKEKKSSDDDSIERILFFRLMGRLKLPQKALSYLRTRPLDGGTSS